MDAAVEKKSMIVPRTLAVFVFASLVLVAGCDSSDVSRPAEPLPTATLSRTTTLPPTATRTFPTAPTSTPAPTNTAPTLFTPTVTETPVEVPPTPTATATATSTLAIPPTPTPTGAQINVARAFVRADDIAVVDVTLASGGNLVGGMQNDLLFDNTILELAAASSCRINPAIGDRLPNCEEDPEFITAPCKTLARNLVQCGSVPQPDGCPEGARATTSRFRAIIAATAVPNGNPIPSTVLYTCDFQVRDRGRLPEEILNRNLVVANPSGTRLNDFVAGDGLVSIAARVSAAALQGANELLLYPEDANQFPATGTVEVLGQVVGFNRTGTRLALFVPLAQIVAADTLVALAPTTPTPVATAIATFPPTATVTDTPLLPTVTSTPTTVATATFTRTQSPTQTASATSTEVSTATPLPTSTATAVGESTATPASTGTATQVPSASPTHTATATATRSNTVAPSATRTSTAPPTAPASPTAVATPAVSIIIGSAAAAAGKVVVQIVLDPGVENVGGVQNDILFDNSIVDLAGASSCVIHPAISHFNANCDEDVEFITEPCKTLSRLLVDCGGAPQPNGCPDDADASTSRFRAIIGATAVPNVNPIPAGVLYTCTFNVIDAGALPTVLTAAKVVASEPLGDRIEPVAGVDGVVLP